MRKRWRLVMECSIFEINSKVLALVAKKYSSKLDIFLLVYSYLCG